MMHPHLLLQRGQILPLLSEASKHATFSEDGARLKNNLLATQAISILNASKAVSVTFHLKPQCASKVKETVSFQHSTILLAAA